MIDKITPDDLAKHLAWMQGKEGGERICLKWDTVHRCVHLDGANLEGADLSSTYMGSACFRGANLKNALFRHTDLRAADFRGANLEGADFMARHWNMPCLRGRKIFRNMSKR